MSILAKKKLAEVYWWCFHECYYFPDIKGQMLSAFNLWSFPFLSALIEIVPQLIWCSSCLINTHEELLSGKKKGAWILWHYRATIPSLESPTFGFLNAKDNNFSWVSVICSQIQFWAIFIIKLNVLCNKLLLRVSKQETARAGTIGILNTMRKYCDIRGPVINCCVTNHPELCGIRSHILLCWQILKNLSEKQRTWGERWGGIQYLAQLGKLRWCLEDCELESSEGLEVNAGCWLEPWLGNQPELHVAFPCGLSTSLQHGICVPCASIPKCCIIFNGLASKVTNLHLLQSHKPADMWVHGTQASLLLGGVSMSQEKSVQDGRTYHGHLGKYNPLSHSTEFTKHTKEC